MNRPIPMSHETLTAVLTDIRDSVASGDSLEGNIEWLLPGHAEPVPWPAEDVRPYPPTEGAS
jgi:hypothetical protein